LWAGETHQLRLFRVQRTRPKEPVLVLI
jgi:hypothetical protein